MRASVRSRRMRSIARFRAVVTIHADGLRGVPSRGHFSTAVAKASCTASSASSKSPRTRIRIDDRAAPFLPEQGLDGHSCSTSGLISTEPVSATGILDATSIAWSRSSHSATK